MTINAQALKTLRMKKGLSQQRLAEMCSQPGLRQHISLKAIYRYEKGETKPSRKKAQWIAEALGTTVEMLSKEPEDEAVSESWLRDHGYDRIRELIRPDVAQNYRFVIHHYGVSATYLINAAPWMFTLLAEESLANRKQRLAEAKMAFEQAKDRIGQIQLGYGDIASMYTEFENVWEAEEDSIGSRDIFGKQILEANMRPPFDPYKTNPFVDYLRRKAATIGSAEIYDDDCRIFNNDLPEWSVFTVWLDELAGGDWLAKHAITERYVSIDAIPPGLQGTEKRAERVAWLIDHIPANKREQLVQEHHDAGWTGLAEKRS